MKSHEPLADPDRMRLLAERAKLHRPRPFAIYCLYSKVADACMEWLDH